MNKSSKGCESNKFHLECEFKKEKTTNKQKILQVLCISVKYF